MTQKRRWIGPTAGVAALLLLLAGGVGWMTARERAAFPPSEPVVADAAAVDEILESARLYARQQEFGKAEAVLRAAVSQHPDDPRVREALGEALLSQDKREEAARQFEQLLAAGSESPEVAFTAGSLAAAAGDYEKAAGHHERAQALDPANPKYPVHLAQAQIALGRLEEAKASLARAAVLDEGRATVWGMLAELALRENKLEMAAQHIARARELEPGVGAWRVVEARILKRRGEPERALMLLGALGAAERWQPSVVHTMAGCLGMLDRGEDALALYEVSIEKRPGEPELRYEAALWAERLGRTERALELAGQARMMGEGRAAAVVERLGG